MCALARLVGHGETRVYDMCVNGLLKSSSKAYVAGMQLSFLVHFYYICVEYVFNMEVCNTDFNSNIYKSLRYYRIIRGIKRICLIV
jgi:hypothetical protein